MFSILFWSISRKTTCWLYFLDYLQYYSLFACEDYCVVCDIDQWVMTINHCVVCDEDLCPVPWLGVPLLPLLAHHGPGVQGPPLTQVSYTQTGIERQEKVDKDKNHWLGRSIRSVPDTFSLNYIRSLYILSTFCCFLFSEMFWPWYIQFPDLLPNLSPSSLSVLYSGACPPYIPSPIHVKCLIQTVPITFNSQKSYTCSPVMNCLTSKFCPDIFSPFVPTDWAEREERRYFGVHTVYIVHAVVC